MIRWSEERGKMILCNLVRVGIVGINGVLVLPRALAIEAGK